MNLKSNSKSEVNAELYQHSYVAVYAEVELNIGFYRRRSRWPPANFVGVAAVTQSLNRNRRRRCRRRC